ncbi:hypothetical protein NG796_01985 [Laspinema sp. A4]|nr:hypothetical protein [Laspinema sp. D2d]MCT7982057.1 hypothetical protein [Laspinema sp. D2d]
MQLEIFSRLGGSGSSGLDRRCDRPEIASISMGWRSPDNPQKRDRTD